MFKNKMGLVFWILAVIGVTMISSGNAWAGAKYFKIGGFPTEPGYTVSVQSSNPACLTAASPVLDLGYVTFLATCVGTAACTVNVQIAVQHPTAGAMNKIVIMRCVDCGGTWYPTVDGCIPNICTAGGNTSGDALDVTKCWRSVPALSQWGIVALVLILGTVAVVFLRRRRRATA